MYPVRVLTLRVDDDRKHLLACMTVVTMAVGYMIMVTMAVVTMNMATMVTVTMVTVTMMVLLGRKNRYECIFDCPNLKIFQKKYHQIEILRDEQERDYVVFLPITNSCFVDLLATVSSLLECFTRHGIFLVIFKLKNR